jgi:hypothetical protein
MNQDPHAIQIKHVRELIEDARLIQPNFNRPKDLSYDWVMNRSDWPWLFLDLQVPYEEMLEEAKALESEFVPHRRYDEGAGYGHRGWKSICVHGLSATQTENYSAYGHASLDSAPYKWTEIADQCPITVKFLKETFPFERYYRVRFMWLEPRGYIAPHRDQKESGFFPCNIALNQPKGCEFGMQGRGLLPIKEGSVFLPNISNLHFVQNESQEVRIHLIIHGVAGREFSRYEELILRSAAAQINGENVL